MKKKETKNLNRIYELDLLRGIAIIFMIFDHFMYDIFGFLPMFFSDFPKEGLAQSIYNLSREYWSSDLRIFFRYIIIFLFMALVGVCGSFSKRNIIRGSKLLGISLFLTLFTYIASTITSDPSLTITFGTLHCIALSLLLIGLMLKYIKNRWVYLGLGVMMVLIGAYFEYNVENIIFGSEPLFIIILKQFIGLVECGGDTMPFLLNCGQVLIGVFIGKSLYEEKKSLLNFEYKNNIVTFIGRNALIVYFIHQILIPILLFLIFLILGYKVAI